MFGSPVFKAWQLLLIDSLGRLELGYPVEIEVKKDVLARIDRPKSPLRATTVTNQPIIDAVNPIGMDVNKQLQQWSSPPNHLSQDWTAI